MGVPVYLRWHCYSQEGDIQSVKDGLDLLKKVRPGVRLNSTQLQFIQKYIAEQVIFPAA